MNNFKNPNTIYLNMLNVENKAVITTHGHSVCDGEDTIMQLSSRMNNSRNLLSSITDDNKLIGILKHRSGRKILITRTGTKVRQYLIPISHIRLNPSYRYTDTGSIVGMYKSLFCDEK